MAFSDEPNAAPEYGSLKTLTVLTFIGSALQLINSVWSFINAEKAVTDMEKNMANPDMPDIVKKMMTPEMLEAVRLAAANKIPILILGLIAAALCIAGAIQMRKLKQQGYYFWLIGEILPVISGILFLGKSAFVGGLMVYIGYGFLLLFIILYTLQRKYLINK